MRIAIVEDEALVAKRIERMTREILGNKINSLSVSSSFEEAESLLFGSPVDLLLLDLNLSGKNGFDLLKLAVSGSFQIIIISANTDKALEAFEYGVLDFVGKPFTEERLHRAFDRFERLNEVSGFETRLLTVRTNAGLKLIETEDIIYLKGCGNYSEIHITDGSDNLHEKSLKALQPILPSFFMRIHKSYIANRNKIIHFRTHEGSKYDAVLVGGEIIPVSRRFYKKIKALD